MIKEDISSLREEYTQATLDEQSIHPNPFDQFSQWMQEAINGKVREPNAMVVATVSAQEYPSQRTVLLKGMDDGGFTFYTNYNSVKGQQLAANSKISLLFPWYELERQVIVNGYAEKISREASSAYFQSRPKSSQIGAWVSNQSEVIASRSVLEEKQEKYNLQFSEGSVPLPDNWGGYCVAPTEFEFWQGRESRLHDRIVYTQDKNQSWKISRRSP